MKQRKKRGPKLDGAKGRDMCPACVAFKCDPLAMSEKFQNKVSRRLLQGLCPSCGKKVINKKCGCKSNVRNTLTFGISKKPV